MSTSNLAVLQDEYRVTGPSSFGTGGAKVITLAHGDSVSGSLFAVTVAFDFSTASLLPAIGLAPGHVGHTPLSGSLFFDNSTFSSLGIAPGTYQYALAHDTVTLNVGSTVPEPSSLLMIIAVLAGVVAFRGKLRATGRHSASRWRSGRCAPRSGRVTMEEATAALAKAVPGSAAATSAGPKSVENSA